MQSPDSKLPRLTVDLAHASFEDFLAFVFDHPVVPEGHDGEEWYFRHEFEIIADPRRQVEYLRRLFEQPEALSPRYSPGQIEQGFWFMFVTGEEWFRDPLWDPVVPWAEREACVLVIPEFYRRLFEHQTIGSAPGMLWDLLAHGLDNYPGRPPERAGEDERVRGAMFKALRTMLLSESPETQQSALHGLFHVAHPDGPAVIRAWLGSTQGVNDQTRLYAEEVLAGRAI